MGNGRYEDKFKSGTEFWFQRMSDGRVEYGSGGSWHFRMGRQDWNKIIKAVSEDPADVPPEPPPLPHDAPETGEIIGYRTWLVDRHEQDERLLMSLHRTIYWMPGEAMLGLPGADDNAGVFAYKRAGFAMGHLEEVRQKTPTLTYVLGAIKMWGVVYEHEHGYRAEHARVCGLDRVVVPFVKPIEPVSARGWQLRHVPPPAPVTPPPPRPEEILAELRQTYGMGASPLTTASSGAAVT